MALEESATRQMLVRSFTKQTEVAPTVRTRAAPVRPQRRVSATKPPTGFVIKPNGWRKLSAVSTVGTQTESDSRRASVGNNSRRQSLATTAPDEISISRKSSRRSRRGSVDETEDVRAPPRRGSCTVQKGIAEAAVKLAALSRSDSASSHGSDDSDHESSIAAGRVSFSSDDGSEFDLSEMTQQPLNEWKIGSKAIITGLKRQAHLNSKVCTIQLVHSINVIHVSVFDGKTATKTVIVLAEKNLLPVVILAQKNFENDQLPNEISTDVPSEMSGLSDDEDNRTKEAFVVRMGEILKMKPRVGEAKGTDMNATVKYSKKKANVKGLPKMHEKTGNKFFRKLVQTGDDTKSHFFEIVIAGQTFYARKTALAKVVMGKSSASKCVDCHKKFSKQVLEKLQKKGETRAAALAQFAQELTFDNVNPQEWVKEIKIKF